MSMSEHKKLKLAFNKQLSAAQLCSAVVEVILLLFLALSCWTNSSKKSATRCKEKLLLQNIYYIHTTTINPIEQIKKNVSTIDSQSYASKYITELQTLAAIAFKNKTENF